MRGDCGTFRSFLAANAVVSVLVLIVAVLTLVLSH